MICGCPDLTHSRLPHQALKPPEPAEEEEAVAEAEPAASEEAAGEEGEGEGEAGGEAAAEVEAAAEEEAPPKPFEPVEIHPDMATMLLEQWQGCEAEFVANMQRLLRSVRNDHRTAVNWVAEARNRCLSVYVSVCLSVCLSVWVLQLALGRVSSSSSASPFCRLPRPSMSTPPHLALPPGRCAQRCAAPARSRFSIVTER